MKHKDYDSQQKSGTTRTKASPDSTSMPKRANYVKVGQEPMTYNDDPLPMKTDIKTGAKEKTSVKG
jgi:hypothetical protein